MKLIYEKSVEGRKGVKIPERDVKHYPALPDNLLRKFPAGLPEVSELDTVRHFSKLSKENYSVDSNFYPLGSCTMKYNPKALEEAAALGGFRNLHPFLCYSPSGKHSISGALELLYNLEKALTAVTGMDEVSLQPMAGAHGEFAGMKIAAAFHASRGEERKIVIVPDTSHGTNPASSAMSGFDVITIASDKNGEMDMDEYKKNLNGSVAAVMMTCPNTLGIFNRNIREVCELAHKAGALAYCDGANMNAIMGKMRPGDAGFDIMHLNMHKTFATPHGGGGPGAGPVCVKKNLADFLPGPAIIKGADGGFSIIKRPRSIGRLAPFFGNFGVLVKAYAYILLMGGDGLADASEKAVLNANYIKAALEKFYELPYKRRCMHECVFSASKQMEQGVHALDIAKFLIDRGFHPPTIYFPLIVKEALMIEPTETESLYTIDEFIEAMKDAAQEAAEDPELFKRHPLSSCIGRLDETSAARKLNIKYPEK
ncbi:MAG: glycine dehydrogenase (aminomethyl-transferring) [Elusimicrobia bacterium HGW-Elusimicrobia-2]|nr:MAG: glycine dehydrogenase (aminomethyl-transferring) [Elusimicrobia bacterium HGW-Elusimicrobia-2]